MIEHPTHGNTVNVSTLNAKSDDPWSEDVHYDHDRFVTKSTHIGSDRASRGYLYNQLWISPAVKSSRHPKTL